MGSEMCIRDSNDGAEHHGDQQHRKRQAAGNIQGEPQRAADWYRRCLLYTSDAADERSSVDLGGRRIIKKKTSEDNEATACVSGDNSTI